MSAPFQKIDFMGISISVVSTSELIDHIINCARSRQTQLINYVNVHAMNIAHQDPFFAELLNQSDVLFCDGYGVKWGAKKLGLLLGDRMTPPDWVDQLWQACTKDNISVFLVGDTEEVVEAYAGTIKKEHPDLNLAGYHHGYFDHPGDESIDVARKISEATPDLILVAMGMPKQERWARDISPMLQGSIFLSVGALFRWKSGIEKRCPKWMSDHGLEWLGRWMQKPRKHFRRYIIGNTTYVLRVLAYCHKKNEVSRKTH